jgi:hypothetical protein
MHIGVRRILGRDGHCKKKGFGSMAITFQPMDLNLLLKERYSGSAAPTSMITLCLS